MDPVPLCHPHKNPPQLPLLGLFRTPVVVRQSSLRFLLGTREKRCRVFDSFVPEETNGLILFVSWLLPLFLLSNAMKRILPQLCIVLYALCVSRIQAFVGSATTARFVGPGTGPSFSEAPSHTHLHQAEDGDDSQTTTDPVTRASWYAVEVFGKVFGNKGSESTTAEDGAAPAGGYSTEDPPQSVRETMARIKEDNEREYFLSGKIDKLIYDEQCEFSDPFVSFKGRDRFVENLENLGSFITEYSAKPLSYEELGDNAVQTKFMVKLRLNLPWKPVLAWPWGVKCEIDPETCLIVLHEESWDIDALEVRVGPTHRMNHFMRVFLFFFFSHSFCSIHRG